MFFYDSISKSKSDTKFRPTFVSSSNMEIFKILLAFESMHSSSHKEDCAPQSPHIFTVVNFFTLQSVLGHVFHCSIQIGAISAVFNNKLIVIFSNASKITKFYDKFFVEKNVSWFDIAMNYLF